MNFFVILFIFFFIGTVFGDGEIKFTSATTGSLSCGDATVLEWEYKDTAKIVHGDMLRLQIRKNGALSNPLIETIHEFLFDGANPLTSFAYTFEVVPRDSWLDEISIDGRRNNILFWIEKVGDNEVNSSQKKCALCGFEDAFTYTCCPPGFKQCTCLMENCFDEDWQCDKDAMTCKPTPSAMEIACGDGGDVGCQCKSDGKCNGLLTCRNGACVDTIGNPKDLMCAPGTTGTTNACERHAGGLVPVPFSCNAQTSKCTECPVGAKDCSCDINRRCAPGVSGETIRCDNAGRCREDSGCQGCPCTKPANTCNGAGLTCISGTCIAGEIQANCQPGNEGCECAQQANGVFNCVTPLRCDGQRCVRSAASTLVASSVVALLAALMLVANY